ncbi:MAG: MerR family transcriptional regulator [Anaerolineae bacterium]|nr:MerR family transcriptional regulator [Anaerolineae bacterium]MBN8619907.1 MerR family transcriptional regulator [Anaerolineae bacterium]
MRSGELAKLLGVADQTLLNWMKQPEIKALFSREALGEAGSVQRIYTDEDAVLLNTIRDLRANGINDWQEIAKLLADGMRQREFPKNALITDTRVIPVPMAEQATQLAQVVQERDSAMERVVELTQQLDEERAERRRDNELAQAELRRLEREIGKLEGRIEEMLKPKRD